MYPFLRYAFLCFPLFAFFVYVFLHFSQRHRTANDPQDGLFHPNPFCNPTRNLNPKATNSAIFRKIYRAYAMARAASHPGWKPWCQTQCCCHCCYCCCNCCSRCWRWCSLFHQVFLAKQASCTLILHPKRRVRGLKTSELPSDPREPPRFL